MQRHFLGLLAVATALFGVGLPAAAQEDAAREAAVKAAFVYNFAKFTEWPPGRFRSDAEPVTFCVAAASPLREALSVLPGKIVGNRPVRVFALPDNGDAQACHLLFIDDNTPARLRQLAETDLNGVLTVSDLPNFARSGGEIGLIYAGNQLRFQINLMAAQRRGITFSSKLLRLAEVIGQQSSLPGIVVLALKIAPTRL
jgi:hypothetical protein